MAGENCSSSCTTKDHASFGECVRGKSLNAMWLGGEQTSASAQKAFAKENDYYRKAIHDGLNPSSVRRSAVDAAYRAAEG